jgi:hypothetical protein
LLLKTTIEIADPLFEQARAVADREGTTLRALVEEGLRKVLGEKTAAKPFRLRDCSFRGGRGLSSEFAAGGWARIRRAIYGDDGE